MMNRQCGRTFPLVIALAMTLSLLLSPFGHAALQGPAALSTDVHHSASALEVADAGHSHSHDAGWPDDSHTEATHGHHAADHSHEVPAAADSQVLPPVWGGGSIFGAPADTPPRGPSFRIERPPRA